MGPLALCIGLHLLPPERYGTMNPNTFADKEIFSPSLLKEVVDTLKNAWVFVCSVLMRLLFFAIPCMPCIRLAPGT